jgi:hypothetical protein
MKVQRNCMGQLFEFNELIPDAEEIYKIVKEFK